MVLDLVDELVGQRGVVRREPVEVDLAQLDVEVVGHHPPLAAEDLRVVVALALQRGRDLDRLHRAAEGAREGAGDHVLQPLLEPLQPAHVASFPVVPWVVDGTTTSRCVAPAVAARLYRGTRSPSWTSPVRGVTFCSRPAVLAASSRLG